MGHLGQQLSELPLPSRECQFPTSSSLPEFINFRLVGKTILVVNIKFELFVGPSTQQVRFSFLSIRVVEPGGVEWRFWRLIGFSRLRGSNPHLKFNPPTSGVEVGSLPKFLQFLTFGNTIWVVNQQFRLGKSTREVRRGICSLVILRFNPNSHQTTNHSPRGDDIFEVSLGFRISVSPFWAPKR